jgi:phage baseplate assembly protein W
MATAPQGTGKTFLGVGWSFPPVAAANGDIATAAYETDIAQSIRIILGTAPGERVMRPDFGAGLKRLIFEPMSTTTAALAQYNVQKALTQWEPRIDQITVKVTPQPSTGCLSIEVRYRVRLTNVFYNLVYPFYLTEGNQQ